MRVYDDPAYRKARAAMRSQPCRYCGRHPTPDRPTTVHHIRSVRRGGGNTLDNLVPACQACNNRIARAEERRLGGGASKRRRRRGLRQRNSRAPW